MIHQVNLPPLTEEQKSLVRNYFETGEQWGWTESQIRFTYGRMKAHWEIIPSAEQMLAKQKEENANRYERYIEHQIKVWAENYLKEHWENGDYECMKVYDWEDWRTLVIGILYHNGSKRTHANTVEIQESKNKTYFKKCMLKYAPKQALPTDKI